MMILRVIGTGRKWGQKLEPTEKSITIAGVACTLREWDAWEGGDGTSRQQFFRYTSIEPAGEIRDDRRA